MKADLLKKSQISFTVVIIKHQNDTKMAFICYAVLGGKKTGQKMTIFHLCAVVKTPVKNPMSVVTVAKNLANQIQQKFMKGYILEKSHLHAKLAITKLQILGI